MARLYGTFLLGVIIVLAVIAVTAPSRVLAAGSFSVTPFQINRHQSVTITITETASLPGTTYYFNVTVTLPNSDAYFKIVTLQTDLSGSGAVSLRFPNDFAGTDTVVDGVYQVQVVQTQPLPAISLNPHSFTVSHAITLVIGRPHSLDNFTRGTTVPIEAQATDVNGKPFTRLNATFNTPLGSPQSLAETFSGSGIYSTQYTLGYYDSLNWRLAIQASDSYGNNGSSTVNILVLQANLSLDSLRFTDSNGNELGSTVVNQTIYVYFRVRYPDGTLVKTGSANVSLVAPNGVPMAVLEAAYVPAMNGFFTQIGYHTSVSQPTGKWSVIIYPDRVDDGNGNIGPTASVSLSLTVGPPPLTLPMEYILPILFIGAGGIGSVFFLQRKSTRSGFEYFQRLTGGGIHDGSLVMLYGESKSGKSLLLEEMLYERLKEEKPCIYITYELAAGEIMKSAKEFHWDLEPFVENEALTLIDNSDLMASLDLSRIRMKLSSAMTVKENTKLQLFIDSMDLLFEDLDYREVKLFLGKLTEEVRKLQGCVYFSLTTSNIIRQTIPELRDIVDWSIELKLQRKGSKVMRTMVVKNLKDAGSKSSESRFKLVKGRGMIFDIPLIRKYARS